jgi:hypothetical protein
VLPRPPLTRRLAAETGVFIPIGKVTFLDAAVILDRAANSEHTSPNAQGTAKLTHQSVSLDSVDELGRQCASGTFAATGIVTVPWDEEDWEEGVGDFIRRFQAGQEVKLPPEIWRRPDTRRRMIEPPEEGRLCGEIDYGRGRVLVVLDEDPIRRFVTFVYDLDHHGNKTGGGDGGDWPSRPSEQEAANEWMVNYQVNHLRACGRGVKWAEAVRTMKARTDFTDKEARAAYTSWTAARGRKRQAVETTK